MDSQFETVVLEKVEPSGEGFVLNRTDGWTLFASENRDGITPEPGDVARFYGKGFGLPVRGVEIVGKGFLYYRTPEEEERMWDDRRAKAAQEKQDSLDADRESRDERWARLPFSLQLRRNRFGTNNPNWRRDYEPYELMVCEEAARFAAHFESVAELNRWAALDYPEQQQEFPFDEGHSGNSFGVARLLAQLLIEGNDVQVAAQHGALCPLAGCLDYGCAKAEAING